MYNHPKFETIQDAANWIENNKSMTVQGYPLIFADAKGKTYDGDAFRDAVTEYDSDDYDSPVFPVVYDVYYEGEPFEPDYGDFIESAYGEPE